jgi:hypothetical protein
LKLPKDKVPSKPLKLEFKYQTLAKFKLAKDLSVLHAALVKAVCGRQAKMIVIWPTIEGEEREDTASLNLYKLHGNRRLLSEDLSVNQVSLNLIEIHYQIVTQREVEISSHV